MPLPEEDQAYRTKKYMEEYIIVCLGGRVAEQLTMEDKMCIRDSLYTELDERARSDSEIPGMSTGFHALDTALTGLNKSCLLYTSRCV